MRASAIAILLSIAGTSALASASSESPAPPSAKLSADPIQIVAGYLASHNYDPKFARHYDVEAVKGYVRALGDESPAEVLIAARKIPIRMTELQRNEIFARHGYAFKTWPWKAIFTNVPWYHTDPEFKESTVTPDEKYLLAGIDAVSRENGDQIWAAALETCRRSGSCGTAKRETYTSHIVIETTWGDAPGQFALNDHAESRAVMPFATTEAGDIYVADEANDRVQHFSREGKLREAIPVVLNQPATEEEKASLPPLIDFAKRMSGFAYVRGHLYVSMLDEIHTGETGRPSLLILELRGGRFQDISTRAGSKRGLIEEVQQRDGFTRIPKLLSNDPLFRLVPRKPSRNNPSGFPEFVYDGSVIYAATLDEKNNVWVTGLRTIRKYSHDGMLLYETDTRGAPAVDGSFLVEETYSHEGCPDELSGGCGIRIIRYEKSG